MNGQLRFNNADELREHFDTLNYPSERVEEVSAGESQYVPVGWDWVGPQIDAFGVIVLWPLGGVA